MEITDGNLSWVAKLDISAIAKSKETLIKYFEDMGLSAEEAGERADEAMETIEQAVSEAMQSVESDAEALDVLKSAFEEMKEKLSTMDDGEAKETLQGVVNGFESVINEMDEVIKKNGELGDSFSSASDILVKLLGGQENYNKIVSQLPEPLKAAITGIQGMTGAAKAFIATPFGATIAAIVLALQAMRTWLNSSVEGQLKLAEITGYLQGVLGQLKEIVIEVGKWLFKAFTDPKKAIKEFWEALKTNVVNRIKGIGDMAAALGKILKSAFTLDFEGVKAGVKELGESFLQFSTGIDNLPDKVRNKIGEIGDAAKEQAAINKARKELEIAESQFSITRAELERKMNEARAKIYDNKASKAEQQQALEDFKKYNEEILKAEEGFIDQKIALQEREMALTTNGIEVENALRDLQAQKIQKQADAAQRMLMLNRMGNRVDAGMSVDTKTQLAAEKKIEDELTKLRESNEEKRVALIRDGYAKQIVAAKLAYNSELEEIARVEKAWKEANNQKLTAEQSKELEEARNLATEQWQQANADALNEMLKDYQSYEQKILDMEQEYANVIGYIRAEAYKTDEQGNFIHNEEEILGYEQAIAEAIKKQNEERLSLDLAKIDATAYKTVEERIKAVNKAYETYIEKLTQKRDEFEEGSEEWLNYDQAITEALMLQDSELQDLEIEYGELNQLIGKRESIEKQILIVANKIKKAETDEEKEALVKEMARLKEELRQVNSEIDEMNDSLVDTKDYMGEISATDIIDLVHDLTDAFVEMSGASKETADSIGIIADGISSVAGGYANGGIAGAILGAISWAIDGMRNLAENTAKENEELANFQAQLDKIHMSLNINEGDFDTIFGDNTLGRIQAISTEYQNLRKEAEQWIKFYTNNASGNFEDFTKYRISGLGGQNLEELSKEWKVNLWDESGYGYNAEFIQMVLDRYGDKLTEDETRLLQGMLNYSQTYQDAMTEIASYLESMFGEVADTIAEQMVDSFLESGEAAMDFGEVVSDVAKNMAKDFIKSMISERLAEYFSGDFKSIMENDSLSPEEKQAELMALLAAAQADVEELQPAIQAYLEAMQQFFGQSEEITAQAMSGNLLQSASQDSVDLLNGQLNAIRTNQSLMASRFDSVLLQLSGIQDDMNDGFNRSVKHLQKIEDNTSEGGSLLRTLGQWIG